MESRLKVLGHPVHPMLVMFPVALFVTAVIFDVVDTVGGPGFLAEVAYWNITVGLIGGLLYFNGSPKNGEEIAQAPRPAIERTVPAPAPATPATPAPMPANPADPATPATPATPAPGGTQ